MGRRRDLSQHIKCITACPKVTLICRQVWDIPSSSLYNRLGEAKDDLISSQSGGILVKTKHFPGGSNGECLVGQAF